MARKPQSTSIITCVLVSLLAYFTPSTHAQQNGLDDTQGARTSPSRGFSLIAEDPQPAPFFSGPIPRSAGIANDASLNDLCAVGQYLWSVGERGVILDSSDGGQTWRVRLMPFECSLSSVSFLTDRIGFVGGTVFDPFSRQHQGIIVATVDGGESWEIAAGVAVGTIIEKPGAKTQVGLPPISYVRFFDLDNAVAIAAPYQVNSGSLVLRTEDGGISWQSLESDLADTRWTHAAFVTSRDGILAGRGNSYGAVAADQVITLSQPESTMRQVAAASLNRSGRGWLVGDGGLILGSDNGGISWKPQVAGLPKSTGDVFDFRSVDQRDEATCVVGSPGNTVFLNSGGGSWVLKSLPGSTPLNTVRFVDDSTLVAVGAFGVIHRSIDGGQTWTNVRNGGHRAAVLCLTSNPDDVSFRMLSSVSGNDGYRSVVIQPSARLVSGETDDSISKQVVAGVTQAGANVFESDWMFTRNQPLHSLVRDELMLAWGKQTDGRVGKLFPLRIAQSIRTWRPDVVCVETSGDDDQLTALLLQALSKAMQMASHDQNTPTLASIGLQPWNVKRVFVRKRDGSKSALNYSANDLLTTVGTSIDLVAESSWRQLSEEPALNTSAMDVYQAWNAERSLGTPTSLMSGLTANPGTASRRMITIQSDADRESLERLVQTQMAERSALTGQVQQSAVPLALIASIRNIGVALPAPMAMKQLQHLASLYAQRENLDGEIAVLKEIVNRFPTLPESADAAEKLFQYYSSSELRMLRRREGRDATGAANALGRIPGLASGSNRIQQAAANDASGLFRQPIVKAGTGTALPFESNGQANDAVDKQWDRNANIALKTLQRLSPNRGNSPRILLRHAANLMRTDTYGKNRTALSRASSGEGLYSFLAKAEMQGEHGLAETPIPVINVSPTEQKPFLDSNLTEPCWQDAIEIRLIDHEASLVSADPDCLIMMTWDDEYIYLAGRIEKSRRTQAIDQTLERHHDSNHGSLDRLEFEFDIDRDYTTGFKFVVDEGGQTSERCWQKKNWNPTWHVASDADEKAWRFEAAIPQEELLNRNLRPGALWGVQVRRVVPGVRQQSLQDTDKPPAHPEARGYGLLRFIRRKK